MNIYHLNNNEDSCIWTPTLSVIVPCYNEETVLQKFYQRLESSLSNIKNIKKEIIFINDGSTDDTNHILSSFTKEYPYVKVIHFSRNFGHQAAISAGINNCFGDFAVIIDADLQDPPELIPELFQEILNNQLNVVYCVRKTRENESWFKKYSAHKFYVFLNYLSEYQFPTDTGDFRIIDKKIIDEFKKVKENRKYIRGIISFMGYRQKPFYYDRKERVAGETKYSLKKMILLASNAIFSFSKKPLVLAINIGIISIVLGLLYAIWILYVKLFGLSFTVSGWTSLALLIIFFGGIQLITIGILGQYIGVLFDEIKNRPEYIIDEIEQHPITYRDLK